MTVSERNPWEVPTGSSASLFALDARTRDRLVGEYKDALTARGISPQATTIRTDVYKTAVAEAAQVANKAYGVLQTEMSNWNERYNSLQNENDALRRDSTLTAVLAEQLLSAMEEDAPIEKRFEHVLTALRAVPRTHLEIHDGKVWAEAMTHQIEWYGEHGEPCTYHDCRPDNYMHQSGMAG